MLGKISSEIFDKVIYPNLGAKLEELIVPPTHGVDTGVVDLGERVLVAKTDPVFIVPELGLRKSAWFAVHILASDVVTSGIPPRYALIDLNLPTSMSDEQFEEMWIGISDALKQINVGVIGGHTGRYEGVDYPMLGGFTMLGIGEKSKLTPSSNAKIGDKVVITKGPAIEATALLANLFPSYFEKRLSRFNEAKELYWKMSCWKDGLIASKVGAHAMHDATEGGVWGALNEVAKASGVGITVYEDKLFINEAVRELCELVKIDPFCSISEGTLIICTQNAEQVVDALQSEGIPAAVIGEVVRGKGVRLVKRDGSTLDVPAPKEDPFWRVFFEISQKVKAGIAS
jgi:hydrogenase expression/formation protein HypE